MNLEQLIPSTPFLGSEDNQHSNKVNDKNVLNNLEKQTVDNVRNIVSSTQLMQSPAFYNPYLQYLQRYAQDQLPYGPLTAYSNNVDSNYAYNQNYGLYDPLSSEKGRQNWNWPGASYFPIYIRDPFLQFYNAITSMVEYGPNAGQAGPCKRPKTGKPKGKDFTREAKTADEYDEKEQITFEIGDKNAPQITIYGFDEDIDIGANNPNTLKFTVNLRSGKTDTDNKAVKTTWDKIVESGNPSHNSSARPSSKYEKHEESKEFRPPLFFKPPTKPPATPPPQQPATSPSSPVKGSVGVKGRPDDDDMDEDEKADDINISNDGNKKLFSRDNTGSGIFIHKLKREAGGTAIVGPNGIAYTHPDSLAIAGSGTKVVAVDPSINLAELIYNTTSNSSKPNADGFPPSRVGRVVAVGPVPESYHNLRHQNPTGCHQNPNSETVNPRDDITTINNKLNNKNPPLQTPVMDSVRQPTTPKPVITITRQDVRVSDLLNQINQLGALQNLKSDSAEEIFKSILKDSDSLAPYRAHPLLHYDRIIHFRDGSNSNNDVTTLILKPVAKSVAGTDGKAISTPLSRAILRQGTNVDILFEPEAIAIAGPGGIAHAESDLEISYEDLI
ncbi:hypothetical protein NQ318_014278 [Aromia moschata]|uniref:DUF4774 domain-containing protein n=1 Tax=Aromia moschata TaxID=1265417 RepID=A0AAV8YZ58_9CUCU|nr:hypothetical protein NQ318_014278 [Aromia moschata]